MSSEKRTIKKGYEIERLRGQEIRLKIIGYFDDKTLSVELDKDVKEFSADELKALCANKLHTNFSEVFDTLARAEDHLCFLQYDINDYLVSKPLGKGTRGILGVTAKGKLFVNEDEGCWSEYCNTDDWALKNKEELTANLYKDINEFGYATSNEDCEQLVNWILEARSENRCVSELVCKGFNMDFEPDSPLAPMSFFKE